MLTNATEYQLNLALAHVNKKYNDNIKFKRLTRKGNRIHFTLTVISSKHEGSSYNHINGRRISAACWHVYGDFIDHLFDIGVTYIKSLGIVIKSKEDNWRDWCINQYYGVYASMRCNC